MPKPTELGWTIYKPLRSEMPPCPAFYPTKNLRAWGYGVSSDNEVVTPALSLRWYGFETRQASSEVGMNSKLNEIRPAVLSVCPTRLETRKERRLQIVHHCSEAFGGLEMVMPVERDKERYFYHLYVFQLRGRDRTHLALGDRQALTTILYLVPLHQQPVFASVRWLPDLFCAKATAGSLLCLPIDPGLDHQDVERGIHAVTSALESG